MNKIAPRIAMVAAVLTVVGCGKGSNEKSAPGTTSDKPAEVAGPVTIKIYCGSVGTEFDLCKEGANAWAQKTGNKVQAEAAPKEADQRLAKYKSLFSAKSADVDVFEIDVIWPGILASQLIDLKPHTKGAEKQHFDAIIANNTVDGKLVGMPWFTDAGVLYYRKDLLEKHGEKPPTTWEELVATAKKIQDAERAAGNDKMWGYVWQGKAYEGLTCNAIEWVSSHGGGAIVEPDGKISINNPQAIAAIDGAAKWIDSISPKDVLNYAEEEARAQFQSGNAVFMRNWPYAWALAQGADSPVKDKVGVSALPKGGADGRHAAALGGWQLAVSAYSKHPEIAADLVMYLTGPEEQKRRALLAAKNPTIKSLYQDKEILEKNPFFGSLFDTFTNAQPRPSTATGEKYNQVSNLFWNSVHEVLSGTKNAETALKELAEELDDLSDGGDW